ncbi:hypothetical protein F383_35820 [Gossypium arboreum]|uniref:Uncharacterized protein n=1 Tax=Gossypium arboreum TaxID=29729 RepID=A0A0B0PZW7_GOSAR|nr:hypothetical protein F383_35820 [Gossypium arboreum]
MKFHYKHHFDKGEGLYGL